MDSTNDRKIEHINIIQRDVHVERGGSYFDRIQLMHRALPGIALEDVDTRCQFLGRELSFPLLISSMTGGDHQLIRTINQNLAKAAQQCKVAMAVGSQRVMFTNPKARESFELRTFAPDVPLIGNIGAVQLNKGFDAQMCQQTVDVLDADGLYLHLNPLQEAIQPEGDTDFRSLDAKIRSVVSQLKVPVLLKEVGSGLSPMDVEQGLDCGVSYFDVAGRGGTSWSRIEHHRNHTDGDELGICFQDWGLDTVSALKMLKPYAERATFISSGGVRNGIDMVKSVILGASVCGVAAPLLKPAMHSSEAVVQEIERLRKEFTTAMFLLGTKEIKCLLNNSALMYEAR